MLSDMHSKPLYIGKVSVYGRIVMPPMATSLATEDGRVTDKLIDFYDARAKNANISLIITEHCYISEQGKAKPLQLSISSDEDVAGLKKLTDIIHLHGKKAFAQINYAPKTDINDFLPEQIGEIINLFADAAQRARVAGYDGVEVHSAHGYLLNQFYSPLKNHRKDSYGGNIECRMQIHKKVLQSVRAAVGRDYPISVRLGGCDYMKGGSTIGEASLAAQILEEAGADMISVSGGLCRYTRPGHDEPGYFAEVSKSVKSKVSIPVMLTGVIKKINDVERLLVNNSADLIGVGRALLKNPVWEI